MVYFCAVFSLFPMGKKDIIFCFVYVCVFTHISSHYTSEFKNIKEHIQHILK